MEASMKLIRGQYQMERVLAETENAVLYKCWDRLRYCYVVSKVAKTRQGERELTNEIAILKLLRQEPRCHGFPWFIGVAVEEGIRYCMMEYINGYNLMEELTRTQYSRGEILEWLTELIHIMHRLHIMTPAIIYRDLKPGNIMRSFDGKITLIDYGIAKEKKGEAAADAVAAGTKEYAAPEQWGDWQGKGQYCTDERSDIYSFGKTAQAIFRMAGKKPAGEIDRILTRCTARLPLNRYGSFRELQKEWNSVDHLYFPG